jgi:hypothetical protein
MTRIKCLNGPAKGLETEVESALAIGDLVSIPVADSGYANGQKYEHYSAVGFIGDRWLLCLAKLDSVPACNHA